MAPDSSGNAAGTSGFTDSYALMRQTNVTAVCATCHALQGSTGTIDIPIGLLAYDPGFSPAEATVAVRAAYTTASPTAEHSIGATADPDNSITAFTESNWQNDTAGDGKLTFDLGASAAITAGPGVNLDGAGLYCASCHAPHGNYGQMVNNWVKVDEGTTIVMRIEPDQSIPAITGVIELTGWLDVDEDANGGDGAWLVSFAGADGTGVVTTADSSCTPGLYDDGADDLLGTADDSGCLYASVDDGAGQRVSLYGYKLLTAYPNHDYAGGENSWSTQASNADGNGWCGTCHGPREDDPANGYHNHNTGCDYCHGNGRTDPNGPSEALTEWDFPHTSANDKFLYAIPDALCISCHTPGNLP
jgi:hypothetical protein